MRIGVLAPAPVPPVFGGAERFFAGLVRAINDLTEHSATFVALPSPERTFAEVISSYESWFHFDASAYDLVISAKYPTWMVDHPRHHLYLLHPLRGLYDTYRRCAPPGMVATPDAETRAVQRALQTLRTRDDGPELFAALRSLIDSHAADDPVIAFPGPLARDVVRGLDRLVLRPPSIARFAALSAAVARRPGYLPSWVPVHVAHPPSDLHGLHEGPLEHLFTVSRLDGPKRVDMLIEAMRYVRTDVQLRIAGTGPERERLESLTAGDDRISFLGFLGEDALVEEYARSLAVLFIPQDEDFGLVALEAALAAKPVITTLDAGGSRELVLHRRTGLVVDPSPEAIAHAIDECVSDRSFAYRLGLAARLAAQQITWERVVEAVLGSAAGPRSSHAGAPTTSAQRGKPERRPRRIGARRLVCATTFPVHRRQGGGQLRSFHLYGALAPAFDVEIVSLDRPGASGSGEWHEFAPGFREYVVTKTEAQTEAERAAAADAGFPVDDIFAYRHADLTPEYRTALARATRGATAVVLAHPFLAQLVRDVAPDVAMVYDAHNAELVLKRLLLRDSPARERALADVRAAEGLALRDSVLVAYCALGDRMVLEEEYGVDLEAAVFVPNGVDATGVPFIPWPDRQARRAEWLRTNPAYAGRWAAVGLFVASWHPPNIEAAEQIITMATALPDVLFLLVGGHSLAFNRRRLPPNVRMLGVVGARTLRTLLSIADVGLNPMLRGGGSNLKVLEYMAAGMPVVTTAVGARGQPAAASVVISEADSFPDAIARAVSDPARLQAAVREARAIVERDYDWSVLGARLQRAIAKALPAMAFATPPPQLLVGSA